jgi:DNA-binding transcriptional ArsR family regulator
MQELTPKELIITLLNNTRPLSVNEIYTALNESNGLSERTVKETILTLREEGKITPNRLWKMECNVI